MSEFIMKMLHAPVLGDWLFIAKKGQHFPVTYLPDFDHEQKVDVPEEAMTSRLRAAEGKSSRRNG